MDVFLWVLLWVTVGIFFRIVEAASGYLEGLLFTILARRPHKVLGLH